MGKTPFRGAARAALAWLLFATAGASQSWALGIIGVEVSGSYGPYGARVNVVSPGSPAEDAGVLVYDVITHVNGRPVTTASEFLNAVVRSRPGDMIDLTVVHDKQTFNLRSAVVPPETKFKAHPVPPDIQEALDEIKDLSGEMVRAGRDFGKPVVWAKLPAHRVSDRTFGYLTALKRLEGLVLHGGFDAAPSFTGAGLARLKELPHFKRLGLEGVAFNNARVRHVAALTNLEVLSLADSLVTGQGLEPLEGLTGLKSLSLRSTRVNEVAMRHVARLTGLTTLDLYYTKVSGPGFREIKALKNLEYLDLEGVEVTDKDLAALSGLTRLKTLDISMARITDAGLANLRGMKDLTQLSMSGTVASDGGERGGVTFEGIEENLKGLTALRLVEVYGKLEPDQIRHLGRLWPKARVKGTGKTVEPPQEPPADGR